MNTNLVFRSVDVLELDRHEYRQLHNLLFGGAAVTDEWISWYHKDIGQLESWSLGTRTWGLFDGKSLVGIWSVEPKIMQIDDTMIRVGRCFAVGIHPEYRRQNLFVELSQYAIRQEKLLGEFSYILGFPQVGRSVVGGHLKSGWEFVSNIDVYSRASKLGFEYQPKTQLLFNTVLPERNHELRFVESADYLRARWTQHPDHQYLCYANSEASVVLKQYSNFCHIVDMSGNADALREVLKSVIVLSQKHGWEELNVWNSEACQNTELLTSLRFVRGAHHAHPILLLAVRINANEPLVLAHSNFHMGVEEGY